MIAWLLDKLFGPREWSVIIDREPWGTEVYACITSRVVPSDEVLATGLRRKAAFRFARQHPLAARPPQHQSCRCTLKEIPPC